MAEWRVKLDASPGVHGNSNGFVVCIDMSRRGENEFLQGRLLLLQERVCGGGSDRCRVRGGICSRRRGLLEIDLRIIRNDTSYLKFTNQIVYTHCGLGQIFYFFLTGSRTISRSLMEEFIS